MLVLENELRLGPTAMRIYDEARRIGRDAMEVPEQVQKAVAAYFGLSEEVAFTAMRCAETLPQISAADIQEIRNISHYRKYNRCKNGNLNVGDPAPDVCLWKFRRGGAEPSYQCSLHSILRNPNLFQTEKVKEKEGGPCLLLAASYS